MLSSLPSYISIVFIFTTLLTLYFFYLGMRASTDQWTRDHSAQIITALVVWLGLHALVSHSGYYHDNLDVLPPRIALMGILPNFIAMGILFFTSAGRQFIDGLSLKHITYLNVVRIPVEFVLLWLSMALVIPDIMTFEGWNFDILAGITAPLMAYLFFTRKTIGKTTLLIWNLVCLALLLTILIIGFLSAPFPMQQLGFDQPNIALLYYPFVWLPVFIVPIVLFGHFVSIRRLRN